MAGPRDPASVRSHVLAVLPDAVLLLDRELRLVDHNGVANRWLGLPPDADMGTDAVHPDDRSVLVAAEVEVAASLPGWSVPVPIRVKHADGSWHTWTVRANNQLDNPDIGAMVVVARDTTGRLGLSTGQADAALRELISGAPVATIALDRAGRVRFAAGKGLSMDPSALVGRPLSDLFETQEHGAMVQRALAGQRVDEVAEWGGGWWHVRYAPVLRDGAFDGAIGVFMDITERTVSARALSAREAHLRAVLQAVREPLVVLDTDGVVTMSNPRFQKLFGAAGAEGRPLADAVGRPAAEAVAALADHTGGHDARLELRVSDRNGSPLWVLVSADQVHDDQGRSVGSVVVLTDITAQKDAERRLAVAARTDPVTGAATRSTLTDRLDQALARRGQVVGVLFCDLDGLKTVNDLHGHAAGDRLLRVVVERIRSALRPSDSLIRYGGDEFVVVCDDLPDREEAVALAHRVRAAVSRPVPLDQGDVVPTLSIGVATSPPRSGAAEILAAADTAAYAAKRAGRDTVRVDE